MIGKKNKMSVKKENRLSERQIRLIGKKNAIDMEKQMLIDKKLAEMEKEITDRENKEELQKKGKIIKKISSDEDLTTRYFKRVKQVDELIKRMDKKNNDFSLRTIFRRDGTFRKRNTSAEFLSPAPFQIEKRGNIHFSENFSPIQNVNSRILENSDVSDTEIVENDGIVTDMPDDFFSEKEPTEKNDNTVMNEIEITDHLKKPTVEKERKWMFTGIPGFDKLLEKGIPAGSNIIVAGGPGCGKTIFCSQVIYNKAVEGKDCVFLSMEERPDRLRDHMKEFGFKITEIESSEEQIILRADGKGRIALKRLQPIRLARSIEALLEKASGTLPVDIDLVLDFIPKGFDACLLALDSISAIETAFSGTKRQYRIYIEQLFRYFEEMNITTFMITESSDAPHRFSNTGVEEFLADGIFVFYNFQGVKKRTRGLEIYKLRGAAHSQKIVPIHITGTGIEIDPDQTCTEQSRG